MEHEWKDLFFEILFAVSPVLTAVDEDVELPGVGVEIAVKHDPALLHQPEMTSLVLGGKGVCVCVCVYLRCQ